MKTQEQIKDIYSGKITNWKEVGGNDSEIIPYQRNKDSGSYNYMKEFMGEYELCETKEKSYYYVHCSWCLFSLRKISEFK